MYILNLQIFLCIIEKIMRHGHFCPDWGGQHAFEGAYMKKKIIYANLCILLIFCIYLIKFVQKIMQKRFRTFSIIFHNFSGQI